MSILIKGAKMPKSCRVCDFSDYDDVCFEWYCPLVKNLVSPNKSKEANGCPLVEIPPHGRLIDADKMMRDNLFTERDRGFIFDAPTVIESEDGDIND